MSEPTPPRARLRVVGATLAVVIVALVVVVVTPNRHGPTRAGSEALAIGSLRTIATAQALFREDDRDGDGAPDDATSLEELHRAGLLDDALRSGLKQGYVFALRAGPPGALPRWVAVASPEQQGVTGDRHFRVDASGEVHA